jgi:hypothetical protein
MHPDILPHCNNFVVALGPLLSHQGNQSSAAPELGGNHG